VIGTLDGKQLSGIVVENETEGYRLVNNPQTPKTSIFIPRSEIERIDQTQISLMPAGLLSTFTLEDIMDLLAYLEAGGKKEHPAFGKE
jgi:hypothetical protein